MTYAEFKKTMLFREKGTAKLSRIRAFPSATWERGERIFKGTYAGITLNV
jgi:hypothetical protein